MKFRGFRASLNFASGRMSSEYSESVSPVSVSGAYRTNREEFFGSGSYSEPLKKITPSMVKLPQAFQPDPTDPEVIRASKSTSNLVQAKNLPPHLTKSTPDVSTDPRGGKNRARESTDLRSTNIKDAKSQAKDQKKLEKKRLAEQKKREKIEAQERVKAEKLRKEREKLELQEQAKQEKLRKEREKAEAQQQAKAAKNDKKKVVPKAKNPLARVPAPPPLPPTNPAAGYSTNTLDSSISKTSGPPPYDAQPVEVSNPAMMQNETDGSGNTSFGKPIESDSTWDLINQHRQQISRVPLSAAGGKQRFKLADDTTNTNEGVTGRKSLYV